MRRRSRTTPAHPGRRQGLTVGAVALLVMALVGAGILVGPALGQQAEDDNTRSGSESDGGSTAGLEPSAPTEVVTRRDLTETRTSTASVSYGDPWQAAIEATGVVTRRHDRGTIVEPGQALIWLDTKPVYLAEGEVPVYRTLELTSRRASKQQTGDDVTQLQRFLLDQGHNDSDRLIADGVFGTSTQRAVKAWQKANGLKETGAVDRSQLVFHPSSVRLDSAPQIGSQFDGLSITEGKQTLLAEFDNKSGSFLPIGGSIDLEFGDGSTATGTIVESDSKVGDDGRRKIEVAIEVSTPVPGGVDRVKVSASRVVADAALVVPARALLALAGGGYAVEVQTTTGPELRRVEIGAVVDDNVEITGAVVEGDEVVVPVDPIGGVS